MTTKKFPTLSISDLAKASEAAVKIVAERHKVQFGSGFHVGPGTIAGRILMNADIPVQKAMQIATDIANHMAAPETGDIARNVTGGHLEPAIVCRAGHIICGILPAPGTELGE